MATIITPLTTTPSTVSLNTNPVGSTNSLTSIGTPPIYLGITLSGSNIPVPVITLKFSTDKASVSMEPDSNPPATTSVVPPDSTTTETASTGTDTGTNPPVTTSVVPPDSTTTETASTGTDTGTNPPVTTSVVPPDSTTTETASTGTDTGTNPPVTTSVVPPDSTTTETASTGTDTGTNPPVTTSVVPPDSTTTETASTGTDTGTGTSITSSNSSATIAVDTNNLLNIKDASATIQFTPGESSATFQNEMGAFVLDDEEGRVDGILPGEPGYLAAAINRSQVIGGNMDTNTRVDSIRQINFEADSYLGFYLVQDGTTADIKADLAAGKAPSHPVFFQAGNTDGSEHLRITKSDNNYTFAWEDTVGGGDLDFNDLLVNATFASSSAPLGTTLQGSYPAINLTDISGLQPASVIVGGSAAYDNLIGFYTVDDFNGRIGNLNPGDAGYIQAAIDHNVANYKNGSTATLDLDGGTILAPYLIANGSLEDFLAKNPTNQADETLPHIYFGYIGGNPDRVQHLRLLGDNKFGFEDTFGGGDRDFNDAIVQVKFNT